jgi:hypothetical protein
MSPVYHKTKVRFIDKELFNAKNKGRLKTKKGAANG